MTSELSTGTVVAEKYRLVHRLGEGGMASVWLAHNETLDIDVAIKFIRADLQHPGLTNRLLQEARAAAKLEHPAIVRVSDYGKTVAGDPYIVMELLRGEDLGAVLRREHRLNAIEAVRILLPIAHALAMAHSKGIVHRDLKPDNVFLVERDDGKIQPKLVDFGIAKLDNPADSKRLTQVGATLGSPAYMSPEQARGTDVDARSDIWSFCVLLYEAITGQLPFEGPSHTALVCAILEAKPVPSTELGGGDAALWAILDRGLRKDPAMRFSSMRELGAALARWLMGRSVVEDVAGTSLASTWNDANSSQQVRTYREYSDVDVTGETAVATQLSFQQPPEVPTRAPRTRMLLIAAAAFLLTAAIAVSVVLKLVLSDDDGAKTPASATPALAAEPSAPAPSAVPATTAPAASAEPQPSVQPQPSAAPSASVASAQDQQKPKVEPKHVISKAKPIAKAKPVTIAKPKPTTTAKPKPAPTTKPPELDIKTTF